MVGTRYGDLGIGGAGGGVYLRLSTFLLGPAIIGLVTGR